MGVLTFYLKDALHGGAHSHGCLEDSSTAPTTATITTGWTVGTASTGKYAALTYGSDRASSSFGSTVLPAAASLGTDDAFETELPYSGSFAAGNWTLNVEFIARGAAVVGGNLAIRLYAGSNEDGSNAREITTAAQSFSSITALTVLTPQTTTLTFDPGAFSPSNEYLFLQCAWAITGISLSLASDVAFRVGANSSITTTVFTPVDLTFTAELAEDDALLGNIVLGDDGSNIAAGDATAAAVVVATSNATATATTGGAATTKSALVAVGSAVGGALASGGATLRAVSGAGSAVGAALAVGAHSTVTALSAVGSARGTALASASATADSALSSTGAGSGTASATGSATALTAIGAAGAAIGSALVGAAATAGTALSALSATTGTARANGAPSALSALSPIGGAIGSAVVSGAAAAANALSPSCTASGGALTLSSAATSSALSAAGTALVGAEASGDATPSIALSAGGSASSAVLAAADAILAIALSAMAETHIGRTVDLPTAPSPLTRQQISDAASDYPRLWVPPRTRR